MLEFSWYARSRGNKEYDRFVQGIVEEDDLLAIEDAVQIARVDDELVDKAVGFIVGHCSLLSWGTRQVPDGNGNTIEIPKLTRKCNSERMWLLYLKERESTMEQFEEIIGHEGPLRPGHENYKGSIYNLRLRWQLGEVTDEPLANILLDDPVSVGLYGIQKGLTEAKGWVRVCKSISGNAANNNKKTATKRAFLGGRQMIGKTSFQELVRVLTSEDERLIKAVDYVKGMLIHDNGDGLQRIIDDNITDVDKRKLLTKHLSVLINFLKNQYKAHAAKEPVESGTHGLKNALSVSPFPVGHYSSKTAQEIKKLMEHRGLVSEKKTTLSRIVALEADDQDRMEEEPVGEKDEETQQNGGDDGTGEGDESRDDNEGGRLALDNASVCLSSGDTDCNGCNFLHWFMLKELPTELEKIRNDGNTKSINNALCYILDAHERFMLYQAHVVRTTNQGFSLDRMHEDFKAKCAQEKNTKPVDLWAIIDFKMKWEAMYRREKQTESFGKRGTSWHGNYFFYYIWDEEMGEPVKYVAKMDQILEGTNEQSGTTVLALVEAMLIFVNSEFPGANILYIQSDNAVYYHSKEFILSIPQLNAVSFVILFFHLLKLIVLTSFVLLKSKLQRMREIGGPVIENIVRTETQDGKSLLDAHFAHATSLVKRYLRRVRDNRQNQVTSPSELVEALSSLGGLQNCGTQLVLFDGSVDKELQSFCGNEMMEKAAKKMKKYFGRCNELRYFPTDDRDNGKLFSMHAKAYSDVSPGATFIVNLSDGGVGVEAAQSGRNHLEDMDTMIDGDDIEGDDEGDFRLEATAFEDSEETDAFDELILDQNAVDDPNSAIAEKQLQTTLGLENYLPQNMLTGVKVLRFMSLGKVISTTKAARQKPRIERGITMKGQMDIVSRGVRFLSAEAFDSLGVRNGLDESCVAEFALAKDFEVPSRFKKQRGWARRPPRGDLLQHVIGIF